MSSLPPITSASARSWRPAPCEQSANARLAVASALFLVSLLLVLLSPGASRAVELAALPPEQQEDVKRAADYLENLTTLEARFIQLTSTGEEARGELLVARPDRLRFEYDPPHPLLLVANSGQLLYYDRELKEASYVAVSDTPLWFLLRDDIDFGDEVDILAVEQGPGVLRLTLADPDEPNGGSLTLVFSDNPLQLRQWEVVDGQGIMTRITLADPRFGVAIDSDEFLQHNVETSRPGQSPGD
ncbi:MAG: LolA family protein [Kiloniellales bacterium]